MGNTRLTCGNVVAYLGTTAVYIRPLSVGRSFPRKWLFLPRSATVGHMNETYGSRLQAARKRAGIRSQEALGDLVGVSGKTIRNYETGRTSPDADMRDRLRQILGAFDADGDPVEVALANSELVKWRRDAVKSVYGQHLEAQREQKAAMRLAQEPPADNPEAAGGEST